MVVRKYAAQIHKSVTVSHATRDALRPNVLLAPGRADGTMSLALFTAACSSMTSSTLPLVRAYSHAIATDSAVTCNTYTKNDCRYVSASGMKNCGRCQHPQTRPSRTLARASPKRAARRG